MWYKTAKIENIEQVPQNIADAISLLNDGIWDVSHIGTNLYNAPNAQNTMILNLTGKSVIQDNDFFIVICFIQIHKSPYDVKVKEYNPEVGHNLLEIDLKLGGTKSVTVKIPDKLTAADYDFINNNLEPIGRTTVETPYDAATFVKNYIQKFYFGGDDEQENYPSPDVPSDGIKEPMEPVNVLV